MTAERKLAIAFAIWLLTTVLWSGGCAAGFTVSSTPQFTIQGCVLGAEPIIVGQAEIEARAYGFNDDWILLGTPTTAPYGKRSAVS